MAELNVLRDADHSDIVFGLVSVQVIVTAPWPPFIMLKMAAASERPGSAAASGDRRGRSKGWSGRIVDDTGCVSFSKKDELTRVLHG
jgi:hypothetical protein